MSEGRGEEDAAGTTLSQRFADRARTEALRYGEDPWVFVRELLQNARDAGATSVDWTVTRTADAERVDCRDNGSGMTFEHAQRFLFRLYASSKDRDHRAAGRFGVGFWSVLRFEPDRIVVRSRPRGGNAAPWEVQMDGALMCTSYRVIEAGARGTEVVLERAAGAHDDLVRRIARAAWDHGRFLTCRDHARRPLAVRINGRLLAAAFDLPPPRTRFRHGSARGVVALGSHPRVELHSSGLRVRTADALDDLLNPFEPRSDRSDGDGGSAQGLLPQALLDSPTLRLHLARSDARDDHELRGLVQRARHELADLVARQIDVLRPRPLLRRWADALRGAAAWGRLLIVGLASAAILALLLHLRPPSTLPALPHRDGPPRGTALDDTPRPTGAAPLPLGDLAQTYREPLVAPPLPTVPALDLEYTPPHARPALAVLVVPWERLTTASVPAPGPGADPIVGPYRGPTTPSADTDATLAIRVRIAEGVAQVRLPVPTGHRVIPESVTFDQRPIPVLASERDEPIVRLHRDTPARILFYRTAPGTPDQAMPAPLQTPWELASGVGALRALPEGERPRAAWSWVRTRVRYAVDSQTGAQHATLATARVAPVVRALRVAAGDCDVVNGLLAVLLASAGIESRLVIGHIGRDGRAGGLHAWVEYRHVGAWRALDATTTNDAPLPRGDTAAAPPAAGLAPPPRPATALDAASAPSRHGARSRWAIGLVAAMLALGAVAAWATSLTSRRRSSRQTQLDPGRDLMALLRGAIEHPHTFAAAPAVFERPLLQLLPGGRISLGEAWRLAAERRLHGGSTFADLARRVRRGGHRVLDLREPEAQLVATSMGAPDLDAWESLLARATRSTLLTAVARSLSAAGSALDLRWVAAGAEAAEEPIAALDLPGKLGRGACTIAVLWNDGTWLPRLERLHAHRPAEATLRCAERVADALGLDEERRAPWRRRLARDALREGAR